jgi:hypothetical protein
MSFSIEIPSCPRCSEVLDLIQPCSGIPEAVIGCCPACGATFPVEALPGLDGHAWKVSGRQLARRRPRAAVD